MTLRLTVRADAWRAHVEAVVAAAPHVIAVVKGNGYGFGRATLLAEARRLVDEVAVGDVHEAADLVGTELGGVRAVHVLTPALDLPAAWRDAPPALTDVLVPTVGSVRHVEALAASGWRGRVDVKLVSSMRRYGVDPDALGELVDAIGRTGMDVASVVLHPPLLAAGRREEQSVAEIETWLATLARTGSPSWPLSISHVSAEAVTRLAGAHPGRRISLRVGTSLWHGDKSFLHLDADVLDTRRIGAGSSAGYRLVRVNDGGTLVMIGAGSSHGIAPLEGGLSPFHFARHRLPLLEPPHMHTSMVLVGTRGQAPEVGDRVDVQRPLIATTVDELVFT